MIAHDSSIHLIRNSYVSVTLATQSFRVHYCGLGVIKRTGGKRGISPQGIPISIIQTCKQLVCTVCAKLATCLKESNKACVVRGDCARCGRNKDRFYKSEGKPGETLGVSWAKRCRDWRPVQEFRVVLGITGSE